MNTSLICSDCTDTFNKGWITVQSGEDSHTFCCYPCYQSNPVLTPTTSVSKSTRDEVVITPLSPYQPITSFQFLTETEINELTNEEYRNYTDDLDEQFILNPVKSEVYHKGLQDDKHVKELEDEYNDHSSDEGVNDDY